ncbi:hypothetical protein ACHAPE_006071 [Trichoderma viride]
MKFFAVATILAIAVSAAPTKELCPAPIVPIPSYGLPTPPVDGVIPPVNGVIPPVNIATPPVNVATPPVDDVIPPVNVATPPVNAVIPPISGGNGSGEFECPSGLYSNPQCCSTDVLGVADLDCQVPRSIPKNGADFQAICAATGKEPRCCVLPILGQSLLCQDVIGAY